MKEKISVIIPVYNVQEYLRECIASVQCQTHSDLEILAVNDGSTDSSRDILVELAKQDPRVQILDKPNGGLSDARNFGIAHATGDTIAFIDGDDCIEPTMMELLFHALKSTNSDIAVSDMEYFYEDERPSTFSNGGDFEHGSVLETPRLISINNSACNKLYCRELFEDIKFPKGMWYEDLATVPALLYQAKGIVKVNEPCYRYRQRSGSIAHSADPRIFDIYRAIELVEDYVKDHGNEKEVIEELKHLYVLHGLDLTTLRIKDFDDKTLRAEYLAENMKYLVQYAPNYEQDILYRQAGIKKKMIYHLLKKKKWDMVLKLYDR